MTVSQVWRCESMKPGNDDRAGGVDHLRIADREVVADGRDLLVFDEDVAAEDVARLGVHRQDMAAAEQDALGHEAPFAQG